MKRILICIIVAYNLLTGCVKAAELVKISRVDTKDIIQIYFTFDLVPQVTTHENNRRIDLIFSKTSRHPAVSLFEPDDNIVKILPRREKGDLILSLFFRYRPQNYRTTNSTDGKLVFEVLLGNEYSKSYQELADRLKGLTVLDRITPDLSNPYLLSPYKKDWMSFFSQYESEVEIKVPVKFNSPPFPIIKLLPPGLEDNQQILGDEIPLLAEKGLWDSVSEKLLEDILTTNDVETTKLLALTYGEALARSGDFANAFKQLYLLMDTYKEELLGTYANFLLLNLRAIYENPHIAEYEYRDLKSAISNNNPLAPYLLLSQIETALASSEYKRLNILLQKDEIALPQDVAEIIRIRQADYWYAIKQPAKAYAAYRIQSESPALSGMPHSLAGYCNTHYDQKKFIEAADCYEKLGTLVSSKEISGLISFRENMSKLKYFEDLTLEDNFSQIENIYGDTEAGFRAAIKVNDLLLLRNKNWASQAIENYEKIAEASSSRSIREEALFKKSLLYEQLGQTDLSIQQLQRLLREFQTGEVRNSAQALLIDILPKQIKRLVDDREFVQALVLAKQNKILFQNNWLDSRFLVDIAEAYNQIGIYDEAQKLYLYLIEITPVDPREKFFLPMIQATFDHGNYSLVEDYAAQYSYTYDNGKYGSEILFLRLQALVADERLEDAVNLLPRPLPQDIEYLKLAASLYFRTDEYIKCLEVFRILSLLENTNDPQLQFMYAESLYKSGIFDEAERAFMEVDYQNEFYDQSLFRLSELARKKGNEKKALSYFKKIVEKGKSPRWKQYAERELQFDEAAQHF